MKTWLPRWFACLVMAHSFVPVIAAGPDDAEIARLVKQIGSDKYKERQAAMKRLTEIGEPALTALDKVTTPLEARLRAEAVITAIEKDLQRRLIGHTGGVVTISVSADGKCLLTGGSDNTLRLWDAATGKCLRVFDGHTGNVRGAALAPDGKRILSAGDDSTVRLWDVATGKELLKMTGPGAGWEVAFGPQGQALFAASLWDLNTGKHLGAFARADPGHSLYFGAYCDKARLAATSVADRSIQLCNLKTGKVARELVPLVIEGGSGLIFCFSADGKRLASASSYVSNQFLTNTVQIWDVETGKELKQVAVKDVLCIALSPDGKRLATGGSFDKTVRVWDTATGKELRSYDGHTESVLRVAFFPDGMRIASASWDHTARVWMAPR